MIITEEILNQEFNLIIPIFKESSILKEAEHSLDVACPGCENQCLETAQNVNERFYISCPNKDDMGLIEVNKSLLIKYQFSITGFLNWIAKSLNVQPEIEEIEENNSWLIGYISKNNLKRKVFLSRYAR